MTHSDLTELQIEISELEKENQELKDRVKELEVNLTYVANKMESSEPQIAEEQKPKLSVVN